MARNGKRNGKEGGRSGGSERSGGDPRARKKRLARLNEAAGWLLRDSKRLLRKHGQRVGEEAVTKVERLRADVEVACEPKPRLRDPDRLEDAATALDDALQRHFGAFRKSPLREYVEAIGWAVILALLIRAFVFEAFKIPTGSMIPTLHVHDHLFVNKFIYGIKIPFTRIKLFELREPKRGEIIVFEYPYDDDKDSAGKDLIKRVVAVPGDLVQMVDNHLHINGKPILRTVVDRQGECGESVDAIDTCTADDSKWCLSAPTMEDGELQELPGRFASRAEAADFAQKREGYFCAKSRECIGETEFISQHRVPGPQSDLVMWLGPLNDSGWPPREIDPRRFTSHASVYAKAENPDFPAFRVPEKSLLVMGDNRDNSKDGRYFGLVPMNTVKGKAGFIWFAYQRDFWRPNFDRIGRVVHADPAAGTCDVPDPLRQLIK